MVSAYERGRRDPTFATLRKLVEAGGEQLYVVAGTARSDLPPATDAHGHAARLADVLSLADAIPVRRRRNPVMNAPRLVSR